MPTLERIARACLWLHIFVFAVVFGGAVYETMVINTVWAAALPGSLSFMTHPQYSVQPGRFWATLGGWPLLLLMITLAVNWKSAPQRRSRMLIAFAAYLVVTVSTVTYFVPILRIIFAADGSGRSPEELTRLANNWVFGTWGRMVLLIVILVASIQALGLPPAKARGVADPVRS